MVVKMEASVNVSVIIRNTELFLKTCNCYTDIRSHMIAYTHLQTRGRKSLTSTHQVY